MGALANEVLFGRISFLLTLIAAFISGSMLDFFGLYYTDVADVGVQSSGLKVHPYSVSMVLAFFVLFVYGNKKSIFNYFLRDRICFYCTSLLAYVTVAALVKTGGGGIGFLLDTLWAAMFFDFYLRNASLDSYAGIRKILIVFVIVESFIAVMEAAFSVNLLPIQITYGEYFRSTSLHGHPLNNALIVVGVYLALMVVSANWLSFLIYAFGILSIFAFGARTALVIFFLAGFFIIYQKNKKSALAMGLSLSFAFFVGLSLIFVTVEFGLADRIVGEFYFDDSANSRIDALLLFDSMTFTEFLWGIDVESQKDLMALNNIGVIENFWIGYFVNFGLFIGGPLAVFLLLFFYNLYRSASSNNFLRLFCILTFILVASSNNSLTVKTVSLVLFVVSYRVMVRYGENSEFLS